MAGGMDWFRWHHGSVTDPKFQLVARRASASLPEVMAVWVFLLEAASTAEERGQFGLLDFESIDCMFGMVDGTSSRIVEQMTLRGLVEGTAIKSWAKRQPKREREDDTAAERKRAQREKAKDSAETTPADAPASHTEESTVTPCHTTSRQKKPRREESRKNNTPLPPAGASGDVVHGADEIADDGACGRQAKPQPIGIRAWLKACADAGEKPVSQDSAIWTYADSAGIPAEIVALHWREFKLRNAETEKRYRDWRQALLNSIRGNWYGLWVLHADGSCALTTKGLQASKVQAAKAAENTLETTE